MHVCVLKKIVNKIVLEKNFLKYFLEKKNTRIGNIKSIEQKEISQILSSIFV